MTAAQQNTKPRNRWLTVGGPAVIALAFAESAAAREDRGFLKKATLFSASAVFASVVSVSDMSRATELSGPTDPNMRFDLHVVLPESGEIVYVSGNVGINKCLGDFDHLAGVFNNPGTTGFCIEAGPHPETGLRMTWNGPKNHSVTDLKGGVPKYLYDQS